MTGGAVAEIVTQAPDVPEVGRVGDPVSIPVTQATPVSEVHGATHGTHAAIGVKGEYVALFELLAERAASCGESSWLTALRRRGIEQFAKVGFPTTRNEDWHFTSVAPIAERQFEPMVVREASRAESRGESQHGEAVAVASAAVKTAATDTTATTGSQTGLKTGLVYARTSVTAEQLAPFLFAGDWTTLVFVNGVFTESLSTQAEVGDWTVGTFARAAGSIASTQAAAIGSVVSINEHVGRLALVEDGAFTALNTAFMQDGAYVAVRPNAVIERPIHLVYVMDERADNVLVSPRTLLVLEHHAQATVVESYVSLADVTSFTNAVTEVRLAAGAHLRHYKIQRESEAAYHVASWYVHQASDSNYESFSFAAGADLSRTNVSTVLDGMGAHATLNGLYMVDGSQTVDHQTRIEHAAENCTSHEIYKGVLDGESHGVFNGKVYVRPEAQKTDGKQSNNNLLLSDNARIDTKPQLEIFADDVKCTHGATIGRLDPTALFYLKSRGVGTEIARRLLTYAFAADVLEELTIDPIRERLEELTFARFGIDA